MIPYLTEMVRANQEQQVIFDHAGVGIAMMRHRQVERCNQRFAEIYGYSSPDEMVGLSSQQFYEDEATFLALGEAAYPILSRGDSYTTRQQMRRRDGSLFWCEVTGKLIDPNSSRGGSIWIMNDVDEKVWAENALRHVLAEQALILDHAPVGVVFLKNRRVTRCNRRFEEMFGYERGELDGKSSRTWYLNDEDWRAVGQQCYVPLLRGESFSAVMRCGRRDGTPLWCEVQAKVVDPDDLSKGSIWIALDITARKQVEDALAQAHASLEQQVAQRTAELQTTVQSLHREIAERQHAEQRIERLAWYDALTGLPNRAFMEQLLERSLREARREGGQIAVVFLDLDRFKHVNDVFGHDQGDLLLNAVAQRLQAAVRESDTVARIGGDEFVIVLPRIEDKAVVTSCLQRIHEALRQPIPLGTRETRISCSMGVSFYPADGQTPSVLLMHADQAMYLAKDRGRAGHQFFDEQLDRQLQARVALEQALHLALEHRHFTLNYQPQVCMKSGRLVGVEALLRWSREGHGWVSPAEFIPVAEDIGLIVPLGWWVLEEACRQAVAWQSEGLPPVVVAINVSASHLVQPGFVPQVLAILERTGLAPQWLDIELTESVMMTELEHAMSVVRQLHEAGIQVSLDDFGTGYSSLSYLSKFRLSTLKIDRSFVSSLESSPGDAVICRTIVAMARNLGLKVTAEGVETEAQRDLLAESGCDLCQGYLISRPVPADGIRDLLGKAAILPRALPQPVVCL